MELSKILEKINSYSPAKNVVITGKLPSPPPPLFSYFFLLFSYFFYFYFFGRWRAITAGRYSLITYQ